MIFLMDLPIERFRGVGSKTVPKMHELKITTGADLIKWREMDLIAQFGRFGEVLFQRVRGIDERPVEYQRDRKSVGKERTYWPFLTTMGEVDNQLNRLAKLVQQAIKKQQVHGRTLVLKVRYGDFKTLTKRVTQPDFIENDAAVYAQLATEIMAKMPAITQGVRLLGITLTGLAPLILKILNYRCLIGQIALNKTTRNGILNLRTRLKGHIMTLSETQHDIIRLIKTHKTIIIHRHQRPDPDAIGSQMGLAAILRASFPGKTVYSVGKQYPGFDWLGKTDSIEDDVYKDALVIVVDTANQPRVDDARYTMGNALVKIDHHPNDDPFGVPMWVAPDASSTSELIYDFYAANQDNLTMTDDAARLLYAGIVGDTGRFMYPSTSPHTMAVAGA